MSKVKDISCPFCSAVLESYEVLCQHCKTCEFLTNNRMNRQSGVNTNNTPSKNYSNTNASVNQRLNVNPTNVGYGVSQYNSNINNDDDVNIADLQSMPKIQNSKALSTLTVLRQKNFVDWEENGYEEVEDNNDNYRITDENKFKKGMNYAQNQQSENRVAADHSQQYRGGNSNYGADQQQSKPLSSAQKQLTSKYESLSDERQITRKIQQQPEEEYSDTNTEQADDRVKCEHCARKFDAKRIEKHRLVCGKQSQKKSGVFDTAAQRLNLTTTKTVLAPEDEKILTKSAAVASQNLKKSIASSSVNPTINKDSLNKPRNWSVNESLAQGKFEEMDEATAFGLKSKVQKFDENIGVGAQTVGNYNENNKISNNDNLTSQKQADGQKNNADRSRQTEISVDSMKDESRSSKHSSKKESEREKTRDKDRDKSKDKDRDRDRDRSDKEHKHSSSHSSKRSSSRHHKSKNSSSSLDVMSQSGSYNKMSNVYPDSSIRSNNYYVSSSLPVNNYITMDDGSVVPKLDSLYQPPPNLPPPQFVRPPTNAAFCVYCGVKFFEGSIYCGNCGAYRMSYASLYNNASPSIADSMMQNRQQQYSIIDQISGEPKMVHPSLQNQNIPPKTPSQQDMMYYNQMNYNNQPRFY